MTKSKIFDIEGLSILQSKILSFCYNEGRTTTDLVVKFNKNRGYIWDHCERLVGLELLKKISSPVSGKVRYQTNKNKVLSP